jgi:DNA replication protein DnaC
MPAQSPQSKMSPSDEEKLDYIVHIMAPTNCPRRHVEGILNIGKIDVPNKDRWMKALAVLVGHTNRGAITGLLGPRGTGKTQMAACAMHSMVHSKKTAEYITAMDLFTRFKDAFDTTTKQQNLITSFVKPQLLVIDELDVRSGSQWESDMLIHVIDKRYGAMRATVMISNMTKDAFLKAIPESIVSRIVEGGGTITCGWESMRPFMSKLEHQ